MSIFGTKSHFFRAFSISGQPADLGHECPTCHVIVRYGLVPGQTVVCCGISEPVPPTSEWLDLPCRSLRRGMPEINHGGFLLLDTDASNDGGWDEESAAKSDDPSAYEVKWV